MTDAITGVEHGKGCLRECGADPNDDDETDEPGHVEPGGSG